MGTIEDFRLQPQRVPDIGLVEMIISAMFLKPNGDDNFMVEGLRLTDVKNDCGCMACIIRVKNHGEFRADWNPHKGRWQIPRS